MKRLGRDRSISYLKIPAVDPVSSADFYESVFGWTILAELRAGRIHERPRQRIVGTRPDTVHTGGPAAVHLCRQYRPRRGACAQPWRHDRRRAIPRGRPVGGHLSRSRRQSDRAVARIQLSPDIVDEYLRSGLDSCAGSCQGSRARQERANATGRQP